MNEQARQDMQLQVENLKAQLTGDMFKDMDSGLSDKIHNLEMQIKGILKI